MVNYSVSLQLDAATRAFLQGHGYSLYVFKGINAGGGAVSTVWQLISGHQLYDQGEVTIRWQEEYYIGEETSNIVSGAVVSGVNPYESETNIQSVNLGDNYIYQGVQWNPNPTSAPTKTAFWIENDQSSVNNFYVSQLAVSGPDDYIVVQEILGSGGTGSFTPVEVIAMILSTQSVDKGTMITQAFSSGAIVTMVNVTSASITYNKDTGWEGPSSQLTLLPDKDPIYQSMLQSHLSRLQKEEDQEQWVQTRKGTVAANQFTNWTDKDNFTKLSFDWVTPKNPGTGTVSVKIGDGVASSKSVPTANIAVNKSGGKITNNTDKTISYTLE
jgi:hypothetical protein